MGALLPLLLGLVSLVASGCPGGREAPAALDPTTGPAAAPTPPATIDLACPSAVARADPVLEEAEQRAAVLATGTPPPMSGRVGAAVADLAAALDRCTEVLAAEATPSPAHFARRAAAAVDLLARSLRAGDAEEARFAVDRTRSAIDGLRRALPATSETSEDTRPGQANRP
ncbi:MAG TPA: hypothetical protein VHF25_09275 [Nitriliruptorales bacterium]|nr:hypothetical protein [Nitriliruptorales bacterium]